VPLRKTFRPNRDTFYVTLFPANDQSGDRGQNGAEHKEQETASLTYELLLGR